jgi:hypothetical protein
MDRKTYTIAGKTFYQEELVFGQEVWLRDHVFRGKAVSALSSAQLMGMLQQHGMMFLAIILIEEGTTQADKVAAGWGKVETLAGWLTANVRPREVMEYVHDFFAVNPPTNLWLLADATALNHEEIGSPSVLSS